MGKVRAGSEGACERVCVCVCVCVRSHTLTQTCSLQPSTWGGRQEELSKRGRRALDLFWVPVRTGGQQDARVHTALTLPSAGGSKQLTAKACA